MYTLCFNKKKHAQNKPRSIAKSKEWPCAIIPNNTQHIDSKKGGKQVKHIASMLLIYLKSNRQSLF